MELRHGEAVRSPFWADCMAGAMGMHAPGNKTYHPILLQCVKHFEELWSAHTGVRAFGSKHLLKSLMYFTFWNQLRFPNQRSSEPPPQQACWPSLSLHCLLIKTASTTFDVRFLKKTPAAPLLVSFVTLWLFLKLLRIVHFHLGSLIPAQPAGH